MTGTLSTHMVDRPAGVAGLVDWSEVPDDVWPIYGAGHPFSSRAWLTAAAVDLPVQAAVSDDGRTATALLFPDRVSAPLHTARDVVVGAAPLAHARAAGHPPAFYERAAGADWDRIALSVSPHAFRSAVVGPPDRSVLATGLEDAVRASSRAGFDGVLFPYLREDADAALLDALADLGAVTFVLGAGCELDVGWPTLDGYFSWLGSSRAAVRRSYLRSAGCISARVLPPGQPVEVPVADELLPLIVATAGRHGFSEPPIRLYQALLGGWESERMLAWSTSGSAEPGGHRRLTAGAVALRSGDTLIPKLFGDAGRTGDYFQLGYAAMVRLAIEAGLSRVDWGGGNHRPKLIRGGRLYWIYAALLAPDATFQGVVQPWLREYSSVVTGHLSQLSATYSRWHSTPPQPRWAGHG